MRSLMIGMKIGIAKMQTKEKAKSKPAETPEQIFFKSK